MNVLVFDIETTGFSKHDHIVSICWIIYDTGREVERNIILSNQLDL